MARAVSADGSTVVGTANLSNGLEAFRWTLADGMRTLGDLPSGLFGNDAFDVSRDGSIVVGVNRFVSGNEGYYWSVEEGYLPITGTEITGSVGVSAVSGDGSVVVGSAQISGHRQAYQWTAANGVVPLGLFSDAPGFTHAYDVSGDGAVIVGYGTVPAGTDQWHEAFRWTEAGGMEGLGLLQGGTHFTRAHAVSTDGTIIVGNGDVGDATHGFRWSEETGMEVLGEFTPLGVSADGSTIVGIRDLDSALSRAMIWDEQHGARDLKYVLELDFGLDLGDWILRDAFDVSDDGTVIVGSGINPEGGSEAFVALIPEPSTFILLAGGTMIWCCRRRIRTVRPRRMSERPQS